MASSLAADAVYRAVVGIDFGTTGVAAAFSLLPPKDPVEFHFCAWLGGTLSDKAPTRVALKRAAPHELLKFGKDVSLVTKGDLDDILVFHRFKMMLYSANARKVDLLKMKLKSDIGGVEVLAVTVVARCLHAIKTAVLKDIIKIAHVTPGEIRWVLTVPAIWGEQAKGFMRAAAVEATIIPEITSDQLKLALEPECAAIHAYGEMFNFVSGNKYMVVDAGGGTIDITVHHVTQNSSAFGFEINEVHKASGNDLGGTSVDKQFINFLQELFPSKDVASACDGGGGGGFYDLLTNEWESAKIQFGTEKGTEPVNINLRDLVDDVPGLDVNSAVADYNRRHPALPIIAGRRGAIVLPAALMHTFFEKSFTGIRTHLDGLFQHPDVQGVQCILLVGGFANCKLLQNLVKSVADSVGCKMVVPVNPHLTVVNGAVRFGINPSAIGSRKARNSYGIRTSQKWTDGCDLPVSRKVWDAKLNCFYVHNCFSSFVREGQKVSVDAEVKETYFPMYDEQEDVRVEIIASPSSTVKYADDPDSHVFTVGTVLVKVPKAGLQSTKPAHVTMKFGSTEIEVVASTSLGTQRCAVSFHSG